MVYIEGGEKKMKKTIILIIVFAITLLVVPIGSTRAQMMGNFYNNNANSQTEQQYRQNLQNFTDNILKAQKVSSVSQIDCRKISSDQFEKIGDAWMDVRIGNQAIHERMDQMMGGEGSQSLTNAHIQMGENYLSCNKNGTTYNWMGMMQGLHNSSSKGGGFPMMGWGNGYGNMMGGNFGWGIGALGLLFWFAAFVDLILFGVFLWKRIRK